MTADVSVLSFPAERAKAFIDAVVAIAMTLLILPLMESVTELPDSVSGAHWLDEHSEDLIGFVVSFAVIATFWITHHRFFARIERVTTPFLWLTMPWLLTIVWLPVATSLSNHLAAGDVVVKLLYIGSMSLTAWLMLAQRIYMKRRPSLHDVSPDEMRSGTAATIAMGLLFAVALVLAILFPAIGYAALFVMAITGVVERLIRRILP
jgi:uncharacterized membrane protein